MMAKYIEEPSTPFSNSTEYAVFMDNFCCRCEKGVLSDDGFPEFPEKGGCQIWDALERAMFDPQCFPSKEIVRLLDADGSVKYWNVCKHFTTKDEALMDAYRNLFDAEAALDKQKGD
jgi:hypothetical protein